MQNPDQENRRLEQRLQEVLRRVEDNQQIHAHFQDYELQVFHCDGLADLFDKLLLESLTHFRLDGATLLLNDEDHQMRTLAERLHIPAYDGRLQFLHNPRIFEHLFGQAPTARLGSLPAEDAIRLFPQGSRVQSSALLPLMRHNRVMGCFNFGSEDAGRFTADKSADFLNHLARVVAVCLENAFGLESLRHQSLIDVLTQVYNRRSFDIELDRELSRAVRHGQTLACMFIDIDHFKTINDTYGHQSGDECLRRVAQCVKGHLRKTDVFARYGGEEFVALMPEENLDKAYATAERIREAVASLTIQADHGKYFHTSLSIGIAVHEFSGKDEHASREQADLLLSRADHAMYEAKRSGRNRVCLAK